MLKWLYDKTVANKDPIEGGMLAGLILGTIPISAPIIAGMAAVDGICLAGKVIVDGASAVGDGIASAGRSVADAATRARYESVVVAPSEPMILQSQIAPPEDPLDRAQREYLALQERICELPLDSDEKNALHLAVQRRLVRVLKERIDGLR